MARQRAGPARGTGLPVLLSYCPTVLLSCCPAVLLSCCPAVLHCSEWSAALQTERYSKVLADDFTKAKEEKAKPKRAVVYAPNAGGPEEAEAMSADEDEDEFEVNGDELDEVPPLDPL
eukprot:1194895-Prorocentrum_minimum.AAC.4